MRTPRSLLALVGLIFALSLPSWLAAEEDWKAEAAARIDGLNKNIKESYERDIGGSRNELMKRRDIAWKESVDRMLDEMPPLEASCARLIIEQNKPGATGKNLFTIEKKAKQQAANYRELARQERIRPTAPDAAWKTKLVVEMLALANAESPAAPDPNTAIAQQ